ncbi:ChaN family lipoprotein [Hydrogenophaga sp. 5NK40-0174]|uniref:ChaN family lipoprotein n=1 Tax=Hydrogenophaga sp. 5NK40-0174 TaxID=3127649 RepID=UPI003109F7AE
MMVTLRALVCRAGQPAEAGSLAARRMVASAVTTITLALAGCTAATQPASPDLATASALVRQLPDAPLIVLGEEHDAPAHHQLEKEVVSHLVQRKRLGALLLEMADQGVSTAGLAKNAPEATVRQQLHWNDSGWPWTSYGPAIMTAVAAGVEVRGANLPKARHREVMASAALDPHLPEKQSQALLTHIELAHCRLLPRTQLQPMLRIQLARDATMAQTAATAVETSQRHGHTVVLITGAEHARRDRGLTTHLPDSLSPQTHVVLMQSGPEEIPPALADTFWRTPALDREDPCVEMRRTFGKPR